MTKPESFKGEFTQNNLTFITESENKRRDAGEHCP